MIAADEPKGWNTQLPNELLVNAGYIAGRTVLSAPDNAGLINWRAVTLGSFELGNYANAAGGILLFELGDFSSRTVSNSSIGHALPSVIGLGSTPVDKPRFTVYLSLGAFALGHFLPMDGTVFRKSRSSEYDPLISVVGLGGTYRFKNVIVSFSANLSATPLDTNAPDYDYGGLSVGWVFD